jgi:hypothetical protein
VGWKQQLRVEHLHRAGEHDGCQRWLTGHGIPTRVARKTLTVVPRACGTRLRMRPPTHG